MTGFVSDDMAALASYIADAHELVLPDNVMDCAKAHLLDSIASIIAGSILPAGIRASEWINLEITGRGDQARVLGTTLRASPFASALANGLAAHAGETDDSHAASLSHPGCSLVPAAIATGELRNASGLDLLRAVVVGYDVGCRIGRAAQSASRDRSVGTWSSHSVVGTFCSAAASGALFGLDKTNATFLLSYASQLASGVTTWVRDTHHVEKAFVFAGMPASNGVLAASMVAAGCDGVEDIFSGSPNWLEAMHQEPRVNELSAGLGQEFEVCAATIKKYAVGSPSQAAIEAMTELVSTEDLQADEVEAITIRLPSESAVIVDNREMPNVNVQYLLAGTLIDGGFSLVMSQDRERLYDPSVRELMSRMILEPDESIAHSRAATLIVTRRIGSESTTLVRTVRDVRGTPRNPMTWDEIQAKSVDLMQAVIGGRRASQLCNMVSELDQHGTVRELSALTVPE